MKLSKDNTVWPQRKPPCRWPDRVGQGLGVGSYRNASPFSQTTQLAVLALSRRSTPAVGVDSHWRVRYTLATPHVRPQEDGAVLSL
jgi:hypothetical protein